MNVYKVPVTIKNGYYKEPDMVTAGGYGDAHRSEIVYASTAAKAKIVARAVVASRTSNEARIGRPKLLVKDI